jgi:hypothetical protein
MKENQKEGKDNDVNAKDDTLGENSEQTPLVKEVRKEKAEKEEKTVKK